MSSENNINHEDYADQVIVRSEEARKAAIEIISKLQLDKFGEEYQYYEYDIDSGEVDGFFDPEYYLRREDQEEIWVCNQCEDCMRYILKPNRMKKKLCSECRKERRNNG